MFPKDICVFVFQTYFFGGIRNLFGGYCHILFREATHRQNIYFLRRVSQNARAAFAKGTVFNNSIYYDQWLVGKRLLAGRIIFRWT